MNSQTIPNAAPRKFVLTHRAVVLFVLTVTCLNAGWTTWLYRLHVREYKIVRQTSITEQKERLQQEQMERAQAADSVLAIGAQNEAIAQARHLTNSLETLAHLLAQVRSALSELRTNEVGMRIARNRDWLTAARRIYSFDLTNLPDGGEVDRRLSEARRIELVLLDSLGTSYCPDEKLSARISNDLSWCEIAHSNMSRMQMLASTLAREAVIMPRTLTNAGSSSLTLQKALDEADIREARDQMLRAATNEETRVAQPTSSANTAPPLASLQQERPLAAMQSPVSTSISVDQYRTLPATAGYSARSFSPAVPYTAPMNYPVTVASLPQPIFQPQFVTYRQLYITQPQIYLRPRRTFSFPGGPFNLIQFTR